jgi:8-oxo-dGTP pyrophosphatase MutT (NUDIX family)
MLNVRSHNKSADRSPEMEVGVSDHEGEDVSIVIVILERNSSGDIWIHQRQSTKKTFPGMWGIGAGGKVDRPTDRFPRDAARRELKEETAIEIEDPNRLKPVLKDFAWGMQKYLVYWLSLNDKEADAIVPCSREFSTAAWVPRKSLLGLRAHSDDSRRFCDDTIEFWNILNGKP